METNTPTTDTVALPDFVSSPLATRAKQVNDSGAFAAAFSGLVPSPCVSICQMDADRSLCQGCWRTLDEIKAWSALDTAQRQVVWQQLLARAGLLIETPQVALGTQRNS